MKKVLFLLLLLVPFAFAAWQSVAAMAIMISLMLVAAAFAVGMGIGSEELKALSKDELYQLIVLALLIVALLGTDGILNSISQSSAFTRGQPTLQDGALVILDDTFNELADQIVIIANMDNNITRIASKGYSCQLTGGGYFITACGGYTMMGTPLSMAGSIVGYAIAQVSAMHKLISISKDFALTLLLPFGIILRTFRFSRGAGSFLMAMGISAHIFLPAGVVFVDMLNEQFMETLPVDSVYKESPSHLSPACDPESPWKFREGGEWTDNERLATGFYDDMRDELKKYLYAVLLKATLSSVAGLLFFIGGLRALSAVFGAEVDVSAIARFV